MVLDDEAELEEEAWYERPFRLRDRWYVWLPGVQFDHVSPSSELKGMCPSCRRGYKWPKKLCRVREASCPECGCTLVRTTQEQWDALKKHATLVEIDPLRYRKKG
jgi:hypothetical protein